MYPATPKRDAEPASEKRLSVTFQDPEARDVEDLIGYLKQASLEGSYRKFDDIVQVLLSPETEDLILANWLKQLKDNIFFLDKENERLTGALLDIDWTSRTCDVVSVYRELLLNLVSAHTYYLRHVLLMIIRVFSTVRSEGDAVSKEENENFQKGHELLKDIIALVPLVPDMLCQLLNEKFPYFRKPSHLVLCYAVNMLNVCSYLPSHRLTVLETMIDRCLQTDTHCPRDTIEIYELEKEDREQEFHMEIDGNFESMAYPLANNLDLLMESLFKFIEGSCYDNGKKELNWESTKKLFRELLMLFDKLVLPTHRCSHVQFIMFYICSLKPVLCEAFLDYLWKKVKNFNTAPVQRQVATFYIGSLLSRALYVGISTLVACMELMCSWVHSYINSHDSRNSANEGAHGTFHCVCQALFYVFAFRHKELLDMKNGFKYLRSLNFERIVTCQLNPLKFCHPVVMQNFASISRNYQIAYCYPVIERNNRSLVFGVIHADNFAAVNTFFPFDPYQLKRSKKWIEPLYRKYDNNEDDLADKEEEDSFFEDADPQLSTNSPLFSYGSSPGFKQQLHIVSPKVR